MQFFKHYTKMRHDVKLKRVIKRFHLKGYGLYNAILESIAESLCSDKPMPDLEETAQDLAEQYGEDTAEINEIMAFMLNQGLFELDEITGRLLCCKIYKFIDKSQTRSKEIRNMIEKYKNKCLGQSGTILTNLIDIDKEVEVDIEAEHAHNSYKQIEYVFFKNYKELNKIDPVYDYAVNRKFLKNVLSKISEQEVIQILNAARSDKWIIENRLYNIKSLLTDKMINKYRSLIAAQNKKPEMTYNYLGSKDKSILEELKNA